MAKSYVSAAIESDLHAQLMKEAERNKISFTSQIGEYIDKCIVLEGEIQEYIDKCIALEGEVQDLSDKCIVLEGEVQDLRVENRELKEKTGVE